MSDDLTLGAEFPAATRAQWLELVDSALKGASFDKRLVSQLHGRTRDLSAIASQALVIPCPLRYY